jgi:chaperonin GroEL
MNPMDLKRGIDLAVETVVKTLAARSRKIDSHEQIEQVATISANNDTEIGKLIALAMSKVGKEGAITVTEGKSLQTEVEIIEGLKFDNGALSRYFFTDQKTQNVVFEDALVLLSEPKISDVYKLVPILEKVAKSGRKLVIIAENVEGEALSTLIINRLRGLNVVAVKAPGFGDNRVSLLQDIAVLTGAHVSRKMTSS